MGIATAGGWPWIIGRKPLESASVDQKLDFLRRGVGLVGFAMLCFILATVGAILIVRQARQEYNEARTENLKELIEKTQEDIKAKQDVNA